MIGDWTDERIDRLKKLWTAGASCSEIANDLACGLTRNAVIGKVARLKLPPRGPGTNFRPKQTAAAILQKLPATKRLPALPRRNPTNSLAQKLAIAEAEPGLPDRLKGEAPTGEGIQLCDLTALNCHWPKGDPRERDFEFCGAKAVPGMPYCAYHSRLSYAPPRERVRHDKWATLGTDNLS